MLKGGGGSSGFETEPYTINSSYYYGGNINPYYFKVVADYSDIDWENYWSGMLFYKELYEDFYIFYFPQQLNLTQQPIYTNLFIEDDKLVGEVFTGFNAGSNKKNVYYISYPDGTVEIPEIGFNESLSTPFYIGCGYDISICDPGLYVIKWKFDVPGNEVVLEQQFCYDGTLWHEEMVPPCGFTV